MNKWALSSRLVRLMLAPKDKVPPRPQENFVFDVALVEGGLDHASQACEPTLLEIVVIHK